MHPERVAGLRPPDHNPVDLQRRRAAVIEEAQLQRLVGREHRPQRDQATLSTGELSGAASLLASGISIVGDTLIAEGFAFGIFALPGHA